MDAQRFDRLTRRFSMLLSRRRLGGLMAFATLSTGVTISQVIETSAKKKKGNKNKHRKKCKNGTVKCGKTCVNTRNNALHCGQCGQRCGENRACVDGECQTGCPGDQILCHQLCVDPNDNEEHCGGCNSPCNGELTCISGECGCAEGTRCGNQCVDTETDDEHCGSCDNPCGSGERCVGGDCVPALCGPDEIDCGGGNCIPDHEHACCGQADCGGPGQSSIGIHCNTSNQRCECNTAGWGICQRFANKAGTCAPCCPGGNEECFGEAICLTPTATGCGCPPPTEQCESGACALRQSDSRHCGLNCVDCTQGGAAQACCVNGQCVGLAGCGPGFSSSVCFNSHCGSCDTICGGDAPMCCNQGPGTTGQCVAPIHGGFCPPPG
jgi:hypothetical protein